MKAGIKQSENRLANELSFVEVVLDFSGRISFLLKSDLSDNLIELGLILVNLALPNKTVTPLSLIDSTLPIPSSSLETCLILSPTCTKLSCKT